MKEYTKTNEKIVYLHYWCYSLILHLHYGCWHSLHLNFGSLCTFQVFVSIAFKFQVLILFQCLQKHSAPYIGCILCFRSSSPMHYSTYIVKTNVVFSKSSQSYNIQIIKTIKISHACTCIYLNNTFQNVRTSTLQNKKNVPEPCLFIKHN